MHLTMKKHILIIFICALSSIGFHIYLSLRGQALINGDIHGSSICRINNYLNCDNALASDYTTFAGLPLSDWGIATGIMIAYLSGALLLGLVENIATTWLALAFLIYLSAGASLVMLGISIFILHLFCPFCLILYVLSFIIAGFYWIAFPREQQMSQAITQLWKNKQWKSVTSLLIPWIVLAILSYVICRQIGNTRLAGAGRPAQSFFLDWKSAPVKKTNIQPLLEKGPVNTSRVLTITEFADFLCSHCQQSYYLLKAFLFANPDIHIEFFAFPLDHCQNNHSTSCFLTKAVKCAKEQNHGWNMHDIIFEHQKRFVRSANNEKIIHILKEIYLSTENFNWNTWENCVQSTDSLTAAKEQIRAGEDMQIQGTPTFFVNGKRLSQQYFIQTLRTIRKSLQR